MTNEPKKRAVKRRRKKTARKATRRAPVKKASGADTQTMVAYIVLALLVIATSFWTGYLVGQTSSLDSGGSETQTGEVTIIEYSDFECPFCVRALPTVAQIKEEYPDVKFVYKHFPLESIHPNALNAAIAAECVRRDHGEEAFWAYHDKLFENQQALTAANLKNWASEQGSAVDSCFDGKETESTVRAHMDEARAAGIRGTPSFLVNGELVVGAQPFSAFQPVIEAALAGEAPAPAAPAAPTPAAPAARVDVDAGNYVLGDSGAKVLIVEFTDYQCPFCKRAHDDSYPQVYENYIKTGKAQYTVRHFPLPFHTDASKASEAVECAGKVGGANKFWAYHEHLFVNQGSLGVPALKSYAGNLGINQAEFDECLDSGEFSALVQADLSAGQAAGVSGTPSFFINGKKLVGAQPYASFQAAIDAELQ